jgi:large subunit ribosomal protein L15e
MKSSRKTALGKQAESVAEIKKKRLTVWRSEPTVKRIERPTNLDRARTLGYKAKQGIVVVRVKTGRGARKIPLIKGGRRPRRAGRFFTLNKGKQQVAEEKAAGKYRNMEVLNSYWVGEDGKSTWYEVILLDRSHPSVAKDKDQSASRVISSGRGRAFRGLTSAGRRSRGLLHKGKKG